MAAIETHKTFAIKIRESATDGSDFSNPDADYRVLFLGEDAGLHLKDSAGAVTDVGGAAGAPDDATYIVVAAAAGLSAEVPRPELDDKSLAGATAIDFTNPTSEAGATDSAESDHACKIVWTNINSRVHSYVSEALGTGDFDVRCRITAAQITAPHTSASSVFCALFVADSSLTASTRQSLQINLSTAVTSSVPSILAVTNASGIGQTLFYPRLPIILRIARVGTTITFYYSENEGRTWTTLATATASTDFQRVGILGQGGSAGSQTLAVLVHWLRKF